MVSFTVIESKDHDGFAHFDHAKQGNNNAHSTLRPSVLESTCSVGLEQMQSSCVKSGKKSLRGKFNLSLFSQLGTPGQSLHEVVIVGLFFGKFPVVETMERREGIGGLLWRQCHTVSLGCLLWVCI